MVQLSVFLIRDAETEAEVRAREFPAAAKKELDESTVNEDLDLYIVDQEGDEAGNAPDGSRLTLTQRVDSELTPDGYESAQNALALFLKALAADESQRQIAFFSAPNRSCASTALMMSCADVSHYNNLTWRLTTLEAASAPAALPIIVSNGLCNGDPQVTRMAGYKCVVEGGMMHCAAMSFNDGRSKCPLMKVFKKMKEHTHERIDAWDEERDDNGKKIHTVNYVQYMRLENENDPWSLVEMNPKANIVVNMAEPKRYMLPPRKGWFDPKDHYEEWKEGPEKYVRQTVYWARQAGCETVIMVVPSATMESVIVAAGGPADRETPPCSVASLLVEIPDSATSPNAIQWTLHRFSTVDMLQSNANDAIPPFSGPISESMHPHEGKDPSAAPANRWAAFPDPPPEVLPKDYPDLPPFSMCLEEPLPDVKPRKLKPPKASPSKPAKGKSKPKRKA